LDVIIADRFAATLTSLCSCPSPAPNFIIRGAPEVLIHELPAARLFDSTTTHGGYITSGASDVLIGDIVALAADRIFPGPQTHSNCGPQCAGQIIYQATGKFCEEEDILAYAIANDLVSSGYDENGESYDGYDYGASLVQDMRTLLMSDYQPFPVPSTMITHGGGLGDEDVIKAELTDALRQRKGIIAVVDVGILRADPDSYGELHVVIVTEGEFNERNELTHVYINDTGPTLGDQGCRLDIGFLLDAMYVRDPADNDYEMLITDHPIWTKIQP